MSASRLLLPTLVTLVSLATAAPSVEAQGFMDRVKKRAEEAAKRKMEQRVEQRSGEATDKAMDRAEGAVKCAVTDRTCIDRAKREGKQVEVVGAAGQSAAAGATARVDANFDFVPGERVLFAEDFSTDAVGDFPRRLELVQGNMEVAEYQGRRFLRAGADEATFAIPLPEVLPPRFTLEFDYLGSDGNNLDIYFTGSSDAYYREGKGRVHVVTHAGGVSTYNGPSSVGPPKEALAGQLFPVRIMADERYVKLYLGGTRVANAPNIDLGRSRKLVVRVPGNGETGSLIGNLRIAAGGKDLYDALASTGRVTAEGIFFDTGSDRIRPESKPALEQIGKMLAEHPELKLLIEGHTDNVGDAKKNQTLSEQRAAAVRAYLVSNHGVAEPRVASKGFGSTRPASPNDTPAGRQQNRRVELVRQ